MPTFYQIDASRSEMREFWWGSKSPFTLLAACFIKLFRTKVPMSCDDVNADTTFDGVVEELPREVEEKFVPYVIDLAGLGFDDPVYHFIEDHGTKTRWYWATLRNASGQDCARIHHRQWDATSKSDRGTFVLFFTEFTDGTFLLSSSGKPDVSAPASIQMNRMPKASVTDLWTAHSRLATAASMKKQIQPVSTRDELINACEHLHVLQRDFHLQRKFFRPRTDEERQDADSLAVQLEVARLSGSDNPGVVAELVKLQEQKPTWKSGIWVLIISIAAFFLIGAARQDWKFTLWLIPILLLHEAGHWFAMRVFKYRNLRMFFIPLFGAAVTGQHWNVPGWKKAMVSLAGPMPGIIIGAFLGIIGMKLGKPIFKEAAFLLIIINAFNLLPVLPLDGGHFLHATLFCRNRWLDISFRVAAVLGLALLSILGMGQFLIYLGISLVIGLPVAFKLGKIIDRYRGHDLPAPTEGEDRIPNATAQVLINAVKEEFPTTTGNVALARHTLNIFETINARPPGTLATLGLLALYGGSLFISVVCGLLLVVSKQGDLKDIMSAAMRQPKLGIHCSETETWRGPQSREDSPVNLVVTTFAKQADATNEFGALKSQFPATAAATLFGQTLVLRLPAEDGALRETWFTTLEGRSTNTFVVPTNNAVNLSLTFIAHDAQSATNLQEELSDYFQSPMSGQLIPPWAAQAKTKEYVEFRKARHAWREIREEVSKVYKDPSLQGYNKQIMNATRRGALDEVKRLSTEHTRQSTLLENQERAKLKARYANTPYLELVNLEGELSQVSFTNRAERLKIERRVSSHLGLLPIPPSVAGAGYGSVTQHGLLLEAPWLSLPDPINNLPLLLNWLCNQNCVDVKYQFQSFYLGGGDSDEEDDK